MVLDSLLITDKASKLLIFCHIKHFFILDFYWCYMMQTCNSCSFLFWFVVTAVCHVDDGKKLDRYSSCFCVDHAPIYSILFYFCIVGKFWSWNFKHMLCFVLKTTCLFPVLEEWRKRKMERARVRELEVDTTVASQIWAFPQTRGNEFVNVIVNGIRFFQVQFTNLIFIVVSVLNCLHTC